MTSGSGRRLQEPSASFFGREEERGLVRDHLAQGDSTRWLHFSAPGGWGKTALLHRLANEHACHWVESTASSLSIEDLGEATASLVLIDDYSPARLSPAALHQFLAEIPTGVLLVSAGRNSSTDRGGGTTHPGVLSWRELGGLSTSSTRALLTSYGLEADLSFLLKASGGHPRSLVEHAVARRDRWLASAEGFCLDFPEFAPAFLKERPAALALLALSRVLRSELIDHVLGSDSSADESWLREQLFVRSVPGGLIASGLYSDEILRRIGLTNPSLVAEVRSRALDWYANAIDRGGTYASRIGLATDWPYFLRGHEADLETFDGLHDPRFSWRIATNADRPLISDVVGASIGPDSAESVCRLIGLPFAQTLLLVDEQGTALSLFQTVDGDAMGPSHDACLEQLRAAGVLAKSCVVRAWLPLVPDPHPSVVATTVARSAAEAFARPGLDRYLIIVPSSDGGEAKSWVAKGYLVHFGELAITMDDQRFEVIGYDFRERSPGDHMRAAAERLLQRATSSQLAVRRVDTNEPLVSTSDVRDALLAFSDDSRLGRCALSHHFAKGESPAFAAERIRTVIRAACDDLRDEDARNLVEKAYFERTQKQRAVADELGMSYSTFRRHLSRAVQNLTLLIDARCDGCRS